MRIWYKYFLKEQTKVFLLFILSFYFLYVFIDYATHAKSFSHNNISLFDIASYYLFQFSKRAEVLIPVALLVSVVKVMTSANTRNEIVALASGGISLKKLCAPFFLAATFSTLFLYANFQFIQPASLSRLNTFEESYFQDKERNDKVYPVNNVLLEDHTVLLYQSYQSHEKALFDVFWIKNADEIYRIKQLFPHLEVPKGLFVDHIVRTRKGDLVKVRSYQEQSFSSMHIDPKALLNIVTSPRNQPFSELAKTFFAKILHSGPLTDREAQSLTHFFYKSLLPLVCFLIVLSLAPFAMRFGRNQPVFLIYCLSLFGFICFYTFMHSTVILGESQTISPFLAMAITPLAFFLGFGWKFSRL